jgi:hypothetical protein
MQGAPDWRIILSLILFTRAVLCTESKGLPIDIPFYLLYFLHAQLCIQKAWGSRSMSHSISYTFYTCSTTYKRQGAPDRHPVATYKKQGAPKQNIIILFIHSNHRRMKSKGIYIHISIIQVFSKTISLWAYNLTKVYCNLQKSLD